MSTASTTSTTSTASTLILLDWDDTLFPTTWFKESKKCYSKLRELDAKLSELLGTLCNYGKVVVVTNASIAWFRETVSSLGITKGYFDSKKEGKIEVISARDRHGRHCLDRSEWKRRVFQRAILSGTFSSVISIGDSRNELDALENISIETKRNIAFKYIRFISDPDFAILIDQLQVLASMFSTFCSARSDINMRFKKPLKISRKRKRKRKR
jgi:hypothetical protein